MQVRLVRLACKRYRPWAMEPHLDGMRDHHLPLLGPLPRRALPLAQVRPRRVLLPSLGLRRHHRVRHARLGCRPLRIHGLLQARLNRFHAKARPML